MISFKAFVPVKINPIFWAVILLLGWLNSQNFEGSVLVGTAIWAIVIFISILFHEYGHALTAEMFGQKADITLVAFGGQTERHGPKLKLWKEFLIVLAGPMAGFLLAFIVYWTKVKFQPSNDLLSYALNIAIYINLFWTIINLLPVIPLDGGHLVRIVMEGVFGFKGFRIALFLSMLVSVVIGIWFFLQGFMLGGSLFLLFAFEGYRAWESSKGMTEKDRDTDLQDMLGDAEKYIREGDYNSALAKIEALRDQTNDGLLYQEATQDEAKILALKGNFQEAYKLLLPMEKNLSGDMLQLLHNLAFRVNDWNSVIRLSDVAYQEAPLPETAIINSIAHAVQGKSKPSAGWLQCAINQGLDNLDAVMQRPEYDLIRNTPEIQKVIGSK